MNDYIALFSKKYRNRAKNIFKNGAQVTRKNLSAEEIKTHQKQLYKLYENVFMHAKFKLVKLAEDYFYEMKKSFSDMFFVTGYFLENKLVGFDSGYYLPNNNTLEAHYIGVIMKSTKNTSYNKIYYIIL